MYIFPQLVSFNVLDLEVLFVLLRENLRFPISIDISLNPCYVLVSNKPFGAR